MGIALLAIADIWMPLQSLANRLMPARRAHRGNHLDATESAAGLRYVAVRPACTARSGGVSSPETAASPARPLRVVRVVDGKGQQRSANRVVISGRMADVCAELDRLAALEAAKTMATAPRSTRLH
ncbi:hypothetical protein ABL840_22435 [Variovorax sp. NFACC27]|uniref:hypothetical protein n=1 Tax=unclassified Variovorax TaxID=663243 RepID=UPI000897C3AC|nr:hypothetical protein SAMN03159371_05685 [Variovorax sp. NFACC28]SEG82981.1 hypothetical protein SAMN03159365_04355 [Variovorax sp. NFACC29]SFD05922.1 hypothetical protein SAMN03159379_03897 [Variovorax sp. NFACC26]SFG21107.1 hypothetical protein SAMN03159447_02353 [Variovorax sp. NFACC27]